MSSRIEGVFGEGRRVLVGYITAGDPELEVTLPMMQALEAGGVDIIELGIPFSDPVADGPVIQRASQRALSGDVTLKGILDVVSRFRQGSDTPVVLFGYYNPFLSYGPEAIARDAASAGADAFLIVDLPPEEASEFRETLQSHGLDMILLVSPNTPESRVKLITEGASGFIYYVSLTGVTGAALSPEASIRAGVERIRAHSNLPVCVGFGIRTPEDARRIGALSDGVVVGSAIVSLIEEGGAESVDRVKAYVSSLRGSLDEI